MTEHEPASLILCALAGGETIDDLLRGYPDVSRDDIAAVLARKAAIIVLLTYHQGRS